MPLPNVPPGRQLVIDKEIVDQWDRIQTMQTQYIIDHGNHCVLIVASEIPVNPGDKLTKGTMKAPGYEKDWNDVAIPGNANSQFQCVEYRTPADIEGFAMFATIDLGVDGIWQRGLNVGPYTDCEFDWREVPPESQV